jgi:hypothetical protein
MDVSRLEDLWTTHLAGETLTLAEEDELGLGLAELGELRARLLQDAELDAALHTLVRCERTQYRFIGGVLERLQSAERSSETGSNGIASTNGHSRTLHTGVQLPTEISGPEILDLPAPLPLRRRRRSLMTAAAIAAGILISSAILFWTFTKDEPAAEPDPARNLVKQPLPRLAPLEQVATLLEAVDCEWTGQRPEGRVAAGPVRLVKGQATFEFDGGARVELQGPAEFMLDSADQCYLHRGKLHAQVPPRAAGFRVRTPNALIVDLGTEFSVTVDDNGFTDVAVRKGQVEVLARTPEGETVDRWLLGIGGSKRIGLVAARPAAPAGGFRGVLLIDGELREFNDPEEFAKAEREAREKAMPRVEPPAAGEFVGPLPQEPKEPADEPQEPAKPDAKKPGEFRGSANINGFKARFNNPKDLDRAWQSWEMSKQWLDMLSRMRRDASGGPAMAPGGFKVIIDINGEVHEFNNPQEFEKFRQKLRKQFDPKGQPK